VGVRARLLAVPGEAHSGRIRLSVILPTYVFTFILNNAWTLPGSCDRAPPDSAREGRRAALGLVALAGLVIALPCKWWPCHDLLLLVPLGILAAMGIHTVRRPGGRPASDGARDGLISTAHSTIIAGGMPGLGRPG
jgi:hypothetical protein